MKILVMGAGAVGGYFGGVLAKSGEEVTFIARGRQLAAMSSRGLRIESATMGDFTVNPHAVERLDGSFEAELVLFCVKSYQNEQAIELIRPAVGTDTTILTLQNGVGGGEQLAAAFGSNRVLLGAAYIEAMRKAPGVVHQAGNPPRIVFGEEDGTEAERSIRIRDTLQGAGIDGRLSSDIRKALWSKLVFICALSGMTCITRSSFAEVIDNPHTLDLTRRVVQEAYAVSKAVGVGLDEEVVETTMAEFQRDKEDLLSSMYLDLQAGNPLELNVLNGAVSRFGKQAGIETPVNDFIMACLGLADNRARNQGS